MRTIKYHFTAFKIVLTRLFTGKYFIYFIPGILIQIIVYALGLLLYRMGTVSKAETTDSIVNAEIFDVFNFIGDEFYIYLSLVVLAPFNFLLSNKFDKSLTEINHVFSVHDVMNKTLRMIFILVINLFFEFIIIGPLWLILVQIQQPYLIFFFTFVLKSYFISIYFYDFNLERYNKKLSRTYKFGNTHILTMLITGIFYQLLTFIPLVGERILAPVIMTLIATTVYLYTIKKLPKKERRKHQSYTSPETDTINITT